MLRVQVEYYRARAGRYERHVHDAGGGWVPADILVGRTMPIQGAVLEIACGTGHWTKIISGREDVVSVTAFDASPEMIEIARGKAPAATFICADILPPDRAYDRSFSGSGCRTSPARLEIVLGDGRGGPETRRRRLLPRQRTRRCGHTGCFRRRARSAHYDGWAYRLVKTFYTPGELTGMLDGLGWAAEVWQHGPVVAGVARPR